MYSAIDSVCCRTNPLPRLTVGNLGFLELPAVFHYHIGMVRVSPFLLCLGLFAAVSTGQAEIQRCGDMWTNRGCSTEGASDSIAERPTAQRSEGERAMSKKRFIFNDLDLRRLKAAREHSLSINIMSAQEACLSEATSLEDCQLAVDAADEKLDRRIAAVVESEKAAAKLKEAERPNQTVVTVVENRPRNIYIVHPRRHAEEGEGVLDRAGADARGSLSVPKDDTKSAEQRSESPLGSIWKSPGNSIPKTIPIDPNRR